MVVEQHEPRANGPLYTSMGRSPMKAAKESPRAEGPTHTRAAYLSPGGCTLMTTGGVMGATAFIPVEEYLHTSYEPDIDYVDGYLEDRNAGENNHSNLQGELAAILRTHSKAWQIYAYIASRVQVSPTRYRVPDVCVMPRT
jgi:hypothetical protein